jgi:hypothetical protein
MNPAVRIGKGPRETLVRLFCFIILPFELYYLFLNMQYNTYQADYRARQQQESQRVRAKVSEAKSRLKPLASDGPRRPALESIEGRASEDNNNPLTDVSKLEFPSTSRQHLAGINKVTTLNFSPLSPKEEDPTLQKDPLDFFLIPPISRWDYFLSHKADFWLLGYAVLIGSLFFLLLQHVLKKQARLAYGTHIGQLTAEWETQRTALKAQYSFQSHLIQRFKEASHAVHKILTRLGSPDSLSSDNTETLIYGATSLSKGVSQGLPNYRREPICLLNLLNQIKDQVSHELHQRNISWNIDCPKELTLLGDELFVRQILLSAFAYPLYYIPKGGKVSITVTQQYGFIYIESQDHRFTLTPTVKAHLTLPEGFIEETALRQICAQNQIHYESLKTSEGITHTRIFFPEDSDKDNLLFQESNATIH